MDLFTKLIRNKCVFINKWTKTISIAVTCVFVCLRGQVCVTRDFIQLSGLLVYLPCMVWSLSQIGHPLT